MVGSPLSAGGLVVHWGASAGTPEGNREAAGKAGMGVGFGAAVGMSKPHPDDGNGGTDPGEVVDVCFPTAGEDDGVPQAVQPQNADP